MFINKSFLTVYWLVIPDDRSAPGGERRQRKVKNGQKAEPCLFDNDER